MVVLSLGLGRIKLDGRTTGVRKDIKVRRKLSATCVAEPQSKLSPALVCMSKLLRMDPLL